MFLALITEVKNTFRYERRELEAEALATTCRHDEDAVLSAQRAVHRAQLKRAERVDSKHAAF